MKTMKARQGWWDAIRHVKSVARGTNPSLNPGLSWIILDFHDVSRCFRMFPGHLDQLWPATQLTNRWQIASSPGFRCFQFWQLRQLRQLRQPMSPGCWARAVPVATWPASVAPAAAKMRGQRRMLSPLATGCWTSTCMNLSDVQWEVDAVDVESFTAKAYILHTYSYLFIERHRSDHWFGLIWHVDGGRQLWNTQLMRPDAWHEIEKHAVFMTMFHRFWSVSSVFAPKVSITISSSKIRRQSRCRRWRIMNNQNIQNCFKRTPATKKLAENKLSALFATDIAIHVIYVDLGCFPSCRGSMTFPSWQASGAKLIRLITGVLSLAQVPSLLVWFKYVKSSGQAISCRIYEDMN